MMDDESRIFMIEVVSIVINIALIVIVSVFTNFDFNSPVGFVVLPVAIFITFLVKWCIEKVLKLKSAKSSNPSHSPSDTSLIDEISRLTGIDKTELIQNINNYDR